MKKLIALLLAAVLLTGCSLATDRTYEDKTGREDKLVGIFVTFDHLDLPFDIEGYLSDNAHSFSDGEQVVISEGEASIYEGRLYAELSGEGGFRFPGKEGVYLCQMWEEDHWAGFATEGFNGVSTWVNRSDTLDSIEEEGTICVPRETTDFVFYCNPVYMTADEQYYVVQGDSFHAGTEVYGMSMSVDQNLTWTQEEEEYTYSAKYTVQVEGVDVADRVVLVQMSADHTELSRTEYVPDTMPEAVDPVDGAAYLIVEEYTGDAVRRTLNNPGDDPIKVFARTDSVYCIPQYTTVAWPE